MKKLFSPINFSKRFNATSTFLSYSSDFSWKWKIKFCAQFPKCLLKWDWIQSHDRTRQICFYTPAFSETQFHLCGQWSTQKTGDTKLKCTFDQETSRNMLFFGFSFLMRIHQKFFDYSFMVWMLSQCLKS